MDRRKAKIIMIVTGSLLLVGTTGFLIFWVARKKENTESKALNTDIDSGIDLPDQGQQNNLPDESSTPGNTSNEIKPAYNIENELSNPLHQLKGRMLYAKREWAGGLGYANVRSSPEVNNSSGWWDADNLITTINKGIPIGRVLSEESGLFNGYSYRWFKIKLYKPVGGWFSNYTEGYVRGDTLTFKPYQL